MRRLVVAAICALSTLSLLASDQGIRFDTSINESGQAISSPSVWVPFGQPAVIEVPGKIRLVASAAEPSGEISHVQARMYYYVDGKWVLDWSTDMDANITLTPSFERDMGNNTHRVVLMPRLATRPHSGGF